ncbi:Metallo-hydrolase/oxidoreductase [Hymenopellis radicata]|nr:Metallo-hydrolase/oxidoreductase [Hymenopellis radicata]
MATAFDLGVPASDATVVVKAINVGGDDTFSPASFFLEPVLEGYEGAYGPVYSFLIEHPTKGKVLFDLGYRVDEENFAPAVKGLLALWASMGPYKMQANGDVASRLKDGGVDLASIDAVIWSHSHLDHTGDMSTLPPTTDLIVGAGTDLRTYPEYPDAVLIESDIAGRKIIVLSFADSTISIAGLSAIDYFDDGSLYVLDTPGHFPGHISALARVTTTTFVLLGGDCCHHPGALRPTPALHAQCPCPGHIIEGAKAAVSPTHFPPADANSQFDVIGRDTPMLELPTGLSVYTDVKLAKTTLDHVAKLDACTNVLFLMAHDSTLPGIIEEFPADLNDWKERGYKDKLTWAFLEPTSRGFRFAEKKTVEQA